MSSKRENLAPPSEESDLASLWARAVTDYEKKTGSKLSHMKVASLSQVMDGAQNSLERFQDKRHDGGKVDRVRNAFGNHLDGMQKFMAGVEAIGAAAGAFPPAMPVGIVFMAAGRLLSAFAGAKADFDKVEAFFDTSTRFFERLSIIENKGCNQAPLKTAIVRVFSAHLSILALVEAKIAEKHLRMKQWMNAVMNMEDQELAAAYGTMQQTVDELAETVGYTSLAEIKNAQGLVLTVSAQADTIDENIRKFRNSLEGDVRALYESNLDIKAEISLMRATAETGFATVNEHLTEHQMRLETVILQSHAELMKNLHTEKSKPDSQDKDKKKQPLKSGGKGDAGDKKSKALRSMKTSFDDKSAVFPAWRSAQSENIAQHKEIQADFIPHTGDWITGEEQFEQWMDGKNPLLWIRGPEGIGKSFLVETVLQKLVAKGDTHASVAYFHFKEDFPYLQSAHNALACATLQVAESNTRYAETVAAKIKEEEKPGEAMWRRFFLYPFGSGGSLSAEDQLYIVFDGMDEAPEEQRKMVMEFVQDTIKEKARIHVLVTSQPEPVPIVEPLSPLIIDITKAKMLKDIKLLITSRLRTLPRLRKFSPGTKKLIRRKVAAQADGMLYVEHMLRRMSYIGREGPVRSDLDKLPTSLHALYKLMLDECRDGRTPEQYEALKELFAWLAFSKRSLSLAEATELVKLTITDDEFDVEAETIGRSARLLELSAPKNLDEDDRDDIRDDSDDDDDEKDPNLGNQQRSLTFQERSLRQYFKTISVEEHNGEELRTPASAAHLTILKMSVDVLMKSAQEGVLGEMSELRGYAVSNWIDHFNELDPETVSNEQISQVLSSLYRILNNEHNVANILEQCGYVTDLYPEQEDDAKKPWYDRLQAWAAKGAATSDLILEPQVRKWTETVSTDSRDLLLPLVQGHVGNWLAEHETYCMRESYAFAKAGLKIMKRFEPVENEPLKEILQVANAFGSREGEAPAMRAIGIQLFDTWYEAADEEKQKSIRNQSIEWLEKSAEMAKEDGFEQGATLLALSQFYFRNENNEKAAESLENSIKRFAEIREDANLIKKKKLDSYFKLWTLHCDKAEYLAKLDRKDEALADYNEARRLVGDELLWGWTLDDMALLFDEKTDPEGRHAMDVFKSWSKKELHRWLRYSISYGSSTALGTLYRAAYKTKETDLVREWLTVFEKSLEPDSLDLFNLRTAWADYYERAVLDSDKAREALRSALQLRPKVEGWAEDFYNERVSTIRMDLAGLIFSQFRASPDPTRKEALLEELKSLPGMKTDDEFRESHIGMLLANMYRIMGPAREYQNQMNRIFQTCIAGLEDDVSWNDGNSLRLLAKVLSSLDGLQRDARITISAQFSVMDPSIHNSPADYTKAGEEGEGTDGDKGDSAKDPEAEKPTSTPQEPSTETSTETAQGKRKSKVLSAETESSSAATTREGEQANGVVKEAEKPVPAEPSRPAGSETPPTPEIQEPADTSPVKETVEPNDETETSKPTDASSESTASSQEESKESTEEEPKESTEEEPKESDEDITDYSIGCDGCNKWITKWSEPFYLCLICPNIDLCEACHTKRLAWNRGEAACEGKPEAEGKTEADGTPEVDGNTEAEGKTEAAGKTEVKAEGKTKADGKIDGAGKTDAESGDSWTKFCAEGHHYIKGPMKGWKGIKNGVIQIDDEKLPVKDWIKGLKEERWPRAWEEFWRRQGGLRDVEDED
ncbi:hypothetical protein BCR34DRAFT_604521 [Clohesyomyces aquaticus]|uniref:NACHT domain-containing protein n=1 Tax=Clohesyomyces aquaticus TaxID=1231657 RepID=A0A1Y1Z664_9PLEO|nr:hypothetical protein BCR34DRAFT_604521 [Clohesyomyces aquaticus]